MSALNEWNGRIPRPPNSQFHCVKNNKQKPKLLVLLQAVSLNCSPHIGIIQVRLKALGGAATFHQWTCSLRLIENKASEDHISNRYKSYSYLTAALEQRRISTQPDRHRSIRNILLHPKRNKSQCVSTR